MNWFERRRQQEELMIIGALVCERRLSSYELSVRTGLRAARVFAALDRLKRTARVVSMWQPGSNPRYQRHQLNRYVTGALNSPTMPEQA